MSGTLPPHASGPASSTTLELVPVETQSPLRRAASLVRVWSSMPGVQPAAADSPLDRFLYGFSQPLLGLRMMFRDKRLLGEGLAPSCLVAIVCALGADQPGGSWDLMGVLGYLGRFMALFAALAPVPPFLFARYYARIAAKARNKMGFGPCEPYLKTLRQSFVESIKMVVIVGIGVAPLTMALQLVPLWGQVAAWGISALWSLYWIVIEGYDNARTLAPGESVEEREAAGKKLVFTPALQRWLRDLPRPWRAILFPVRAVAEIVFTLGKEWLPEIVEVERTPWLSAGFGLGTALLIAIPGVNVTFRPAIAIGGVHLRARLEHEWLDQH